MKKLRLSFVFGCVMGLVLWALPVVAGSPKPLSKKIRVLVVTGGHDFEKEPFFKLFQDNPDITFQAVEHPNAHALLKAEAAKSWDVLVLYDMHQPITPEAKNDFVARLKEGKGLVVLHHAIASYQDWPEYTKIIGAHYYLKPATVQGVAKKRSEWKEGMHFHIQVADPKHPVTRGITDYDAHDEVYKYFDLSPDCHPLLTTDEPLSERVIAWSKTYERARVVYIQSGHDHFGYENPNYQQIVRQAIRWTGRVK